MSGFVRSEYSFGEYLDRDDIRCLTKAYRAAEMKPFHSMHAAVKDTFSCKWLFSYYTCTVGIIADVYADYVYIYVEPFIYDTSFFGKSCTTDRQVNRFLKENGCDFYVSQLRAIYRLAKFGHPSYPISMQSGKRVIPRFLSYQYFVQTNGTSIHDLHTKEVPHVTYDDSSNELVVDGIYVTDGSMSGLRSIHE